MNAASANAQLDYTVERVAQMTAYGADIETICHACAIDANDLERIKQLPKFEALLSEIQSGKFEQQRLIADGWDFLEESSVGALCRIVEYNKDPDLLLNIAKIANKATRNHKNSERVITPGGDGSTVVVHLGINFVNKVKEKEINPRVIPTIEHKKSIDCLGQADVERFLGVEQDRKDVEMIDELVEEFF